MGDWLLSGIEILKGKSNHEEDEEKDDVDSGVSVPGAK